MTIKTYTEMLRANTFEDRFSYLSLRGDVGSSTFGFDRWINQAFYRSREWRQMRQHCIARDEGCDLAVLGYEIHTRILVHHMNPITPEQIEDGFEAILDPEFLITTTHDTHNAIHYGDESLLKKPFIPRAPGDTALW